MWIGAFGLISVVILVFLIVSLQNLPTFEELENPSYNVASEAFADNNEVIDKFYIENRVPVTYEQLSPYLVKALISTEDERFRQHCGIDFPALGRVLFKTVILRQKSSGGGSTISQQLAKLLYPRQNYDKMNGLIRPFALMNTKLKEWITAIKLERSYTKDEILAIYLNQFDFINGSYGIQSASETYFGKPQKDLKIEEAAVLIGMLKNPSLYNPVRWKERVLDRRSVVLFKMVENKMLSKAEYDSLKQLPLDMSKFRRQTHFTGKAPYFSNEVSKDIRKILDDPSYFKPDGTKYDLYKDGLKIYTTISPSVQKYAEEAAREHMEQLQIKFNRLWKDKDPWSYEADDKQLALRMSRLEYLVRNTDRYNIIRDRKFNKYISMLQADYESLEFTDRDIDRMLIEDKSKGNIAKLVKQKIIKPELGDAYLEFMKSEHWPELKRKWYAFQEEVKKDFSTKVRMMVFAYNKAGEKDTIMSPMDSIKYHCMFLQCGVLAMDPSTGKVKAWVGGIDHKYFQYDHIRFNRQVGSTFKPFVYATAISFQGISPCFPVVDKQYTISPGEGNFKLKEPWSPGNAEGYFSWNRLSLYQGLQQSRNSVSVYLMKQLGDANYVRGLLNNMGIDSSIVRSDGQYRVPNQPSICLGSADLSVYEMTAAYNTFANDGVYCRPTMISRITNKDGKEIYNAKREERRALNPSYNYVMVDMLKYACRGAGGFSGVRSEFGGKTGTTNDFVDGWFMGITPTLVVGTWVGGDDKWFRFLSLTDGQGSVMARPIFAKLLQKLEKDPESGYDVKARFVKPKGDLGVEIDCYRYNIEHGLAEPVKDSTSVDSLSRDSLKMIREEEFF